MEDVHRLTGTHILDKYGDLLHSKRLKKIIKSFFLVLAWVCLALMQQTVGPTLIDLKQRMNVNYEDIATAVSGSSAGYFIGGLIGGAIVDKLSSLCDLLVALCLDGMAVVTIAIPWSPWTQLLWVLCCLQGIFAAVLNTAGMKLVFKMWQENSASPMHILHGGYGIGSFLIPLISNPFLAVPVLKNKNGTTYLPNNDSYTTDYTTNDHSNQEYLRPSRIEFAYLIPAVISISLSFIFHAYNVSGIKQRRHKKTDIPQDEHARRHLELKQIFNPATCAGGNFLYGLRIFTLMILFFFIAVGEEVVAGIFIRAFSIDFYGFSVDEGSYINTTYWISYTVGRIIGFIAAYWIPIRILIVTEVCGVLISSICLASAGGKSATALWVIIQPLGFFIGPLFPSGMGWANFHTHMTGTGISVLMVGSSSGVMVCLKITGYLYDTYGPRSYLYMLMALAIVLFVMALLLNIVGVPQKKWQSPEDLIEMEENTDDTEVIENETLPLSNDKVNQQINNRETISNVEK